MFVNIILRLCPIVRNILEDTDVSQTLIEHRKTGGEENIPEF